MSRSFEIIEPKVKSVKASHTPTFTATAFRYFPIAAASAVLSMVNFDCKSDLNSRRPIYTICQQHSSNELLAALENDYEVQAGLLKKLEALKSTLVQNWNGEDDLPIEEQSYVNTKAAISSTPGLMLKYWRLFPNPNGTLLLSPKDKAIAGISIGNNEFSYAAFISDDKQISGREPFSKNAFMSALTQIHRILGYV